MLFNFESGRGISLIVPDGSPYPAHAGGPVLIFHKNGEYQKFTEPGDPTKATDDAGQVHPDDFVQ